MTFAAVVATISAATIACSSQKKATDEVAADAPVVYQSRTSATQQVSMMPKAQIYKTSVDCTQFVPVQFAADGTLVSFPAPTDLTDQSVPLPLVNGYLLDRRGVSVNSRFTTWTWREYRALPQAPSPDQIKSNLLEDAYVTEVVTLPMTLSEALADTAAVNSLIVSGAVAVAKPQMPTAK